MRGSAVAAWSCVLACAIACTINPAYDAPTTSSGGEASSSGVAATGDDTSLPDPSNVTSSDESGTPASCGNGQVEGDEPCDDGNMVDGDGCNAGCVPSGTLLWELRHDGGGGGWDTTHDLVVLPDDSVALAGATTIDGRPAELVRIDRDGIELWSHRYAPPDAGDSDAWGAAVLDDGAVLAGSSGDGSMFVRAVDADGNERWTFAGTGRVFDATSDGSSAIWIAGRHADETAALWHLDAAGVLVATYDEAGGSMPAGSVVWGIAHGTSGRIATAGQVLTASRAFVREVWDDSGDVAWEHDVMALGGDADAAYGVAFTGGSALAMVGDVVREASNHGWLLRRDTGGRLLPPLEQPEPGNYHGVAIGPSGEIAVSGWVDNGLGKIALVAKYGTDGTIVWRHEITGDVVVGENKAWTVGVRSDAVVVVAGELVETSTGLDRWVAAYAP